MTAPKNSVCTTCPYCGVGCGVLATPDGKGGATIAGDTDHPANFGRLCSKGSALGETLDLEGRLLTPQIGGLRAGWDEALDLVAKRFKQSIREHGPDSVAFYVSGQILTEDYYVANKLMKGFIGAANIDTNSRLCMSSSVAGHKRAFGTDTVPGTYEDLEEADVIVLVGSNLAWCHPVLHQRIMAARETRDIKVVTIDPRKTATAQIADMHLPIEADKDVALFNGLLTYLVDHGHIDAAYIDAHVSGFSPAVAAAGRGIPDCGIDPALLVEFFELWATHKKVVTVYSQGVNQSVSGTDKVNAIINCHLATGRIGRPGMGPFSVTGQPNAMGGREVGGLANMLAAHLDIENADHRELAQEFWQSPNMASGAGLKAVDMFDACASGQIKAIWIMGTNPAVSMPRANHVKKAIQNCDFVVVSDVMENTDTTACGDVLLPALGWGEKSGTVTNSERRISRQRAFLPAPGKAKADWWMLSQVACRMGFESAFSYDDPAQIFAEYVDMTRAANSRFDRDLDLGGLAIDADSYADLKPTQWPISAGKSGGRFFANGGFFTANKKANMIPVVEPEQPLQPNADFPLMLNTGRIRDQWHTMTRTGKSQRLSKHIAEPFVEIHPEDAIALGVRSADIVQVDSLHGRLFARADVTKRGAKGHVFSPIHWSDRWSAKAKPSALSTGMVDAVSGQPALKRTAVSVTKFAATWYGFAVAIDEPEPDATYWSKSITNTGWRMELACNQSPPDWKAYAQKMFGMRDAETVIVQDSQTGACRIALRNDGVIKAVLFVDNKPIALARNFLVEEFSEDTPPLKLLAGVPSSNQFDPGPIICSCFNVGANVIIDAISKHTLMSVDEIGQALSAGTSCGSCRPELANILSTVMANKDAVG